MITFVPTDEYASDPRYIQTDVIDALQHTWKTPKRHAVLVGPGGAGKSTLMKWLFCQLAEKNDVNSPIPLYVNLSAYDGPFYILKQILRYCGRTDEECTEAVQANMKKLFGGAIGAKFDKGKDPAFIILLDGINEVPAHMVQELFLELHDMSSSWTAAQIVITSRYMPQSLEGMYSQIDILPLERASVVHFLQSKLNINIDSLPDKLRELLDNPMYLTLFARLPFDSSSNIRKNYEIETPGDLLQAHMDRLISMTIAHQVKEQVLYTLKYLFPRVAWSIQRMFLPYRFLSAAIRNENAKLIESGYNAIDCSSPFSSSDDIVRQVISILVTRGLLVEAGRDAYRFSHENYLSYFCALYVKNEIQLTRFIPECMTHRLGAEHLPWISDLLHEQHYSQSCPTCVEEWMQTRCTDLRIERVAIATSNCIEIMKWARKRCLSVRFDGLDLSEARFYNTDLHGSSFHFSKSYKSCFERLPFGQFPVSSADGKYTVYNFAHCLYVITRDHYVPLRFPEYDPYGFKIYPPGRYCTFVDGQSIIRMDFQALEEGDAPFTCIYTSEYSDRIVIDYTISSDWRYLASFSSSGITLTDVISTSSLTLDSSLTNANYLTIENTGSGASVVILTGDGSIIQGRTDNNLTEFQISSRSTSEDIKMFFRCDCYVQSLQKLKHFLLIELGRNRDTVNSRKYYPASSNTILCLVNTNTSQSTILSTEAVSGSAVFNGASVQHREFNSRGALVSHDIFTGAYHTIKQSITEQELAADSYKQNAIRDFRNHPVDLSPFIEPSFAIYGQALSRNGRYAAFVLYTDDSAYDTYVCVLDLQTHRLHSSSVPRIHRPYHFFLPFFYKDSAFGVTIHSGRARIMV